MLRMLAPSAVIPPSANTNACATSTTDIARQAIHGPSRIAASAAPRKCPLVPPATGKLSICTAKMNAAVTPSSGTRRSSSSTLARLSPTPTAAAAGIAHATATSVDRNPSGMCMLAPLRSRNARVGRLYCVRMANEDHWLLQRLVINPRAGSPWPSARSRRRRSAAPRRPAAPSPPCPGSAAGAARVRPARRPGRAPSSVAASPSAEGDDQQHPERDLALGDAPSSTTSADGQGIRPAAAPIASSPRMPGSCGRWLWRWSWSWWWPPSWAATRRHVRRTREPVGAWSCA